MKNTNQTIFLKCRFRILELLDYLEKEIIVYVYTKKAYTYKKNQKSIKCRIQNLNICCLEGSHMNAGEIIEKWLFWKHCQPGWVSLNDQCVGKVNSLSIVGFESKHNFVKKN